MHPLKPRAVLTKQQAVDIFRIAGVLRPDGTRGPKPTASSVAKRHGVSEKTIRDIWRGRTWYEETLPLDVSRQPKLAAKTGRPLGRKDSAPRKRKPVSQPKKMIQIESLLRANKSDSQSSCSEAEGEPIDKSCEISSEKKPVGSCKIRNKMRPQLGANDEIFQHQGSQHDFHAWDAESRMAHQQRQWPNLGPTCAIPFPILHLPRMNGTPLQHSPSLPVPAFLEHRNPSLATIQPPQRLPPSLLTLCAGGVASFPAIGSQERGFPHPLPLGLLGPLPPPTAWASLAYSSAGAADGCIDPFSLHATDFRPSGPPMGSAADLLRSLLSMQPWPCR